LPSNPNDISEISASLDDVAMIFRRGQLCSWLADVLEWQI